MSKVVGDKIKSIRLGYGDNMREFGERFSPQASDSIVSRWEKGKILPGPKRLRAIAELGNMTVDELLRNPCQACDANTLKREYKADWYPTHDLDMSVWFSILRDRKMIISFSKSKGNYMGFVDIDINYCPMCGRKLEVRK